MCTITRGLVGFNQLIPMLVLLSCHYRECVQVRLQQEKIRRSLKVRRRAQEPSSCPQVRGDLGTRGTSTSIFLSVLVWVTGDAGQRDSCCGLRQGNRKWYLLWLLHSGVGCSFCQPRASLPAQLSLQQYTRPCRHAPSNFGAKSCSSVLKI